MGCCNGTAASAGSLVTGTASVRVEVGNGNSQRNDFSTGALTKRQSSGMSLSTGTSVTNKVGADVAREIVCNAVRAALETLRIKRIGHATIASAVSTALAMIDAERFAATVICEAVDAVRAERVGRLVVADILDAALSIVDAERIAVATASAANVVKTALAKPSR